MNKSLVDLIPNKSSKLVEIIVSEMVMTNYNKM